MKIDRQRFVTWLLIGFIVGMVLDHIITVLVATW